MPRKRSGRAEYRYRVSGQKAKRRNGSQKIKKKKALLLAMHLLSSFICATTWCNAPSPLRLLRLLRSFQHCLLLACNIYNVGGSFCWRYRTDGLVRLSRRVARGVALQRLPLLPRVTRKHAAHRCNARGLRARKTRCGFFAFVLLLSPLGSRSCRVARLPLTPSLVHSVRLVCAAKSRRETSGSLSGWTFAVERHFSRCLTCFSPSCLLPSHSS